MHTQLCAPVWAVRKLERHLSSLRNEISKALILVVCRQGDLRILALPIGYDRHQNLCFLFVIDVQVAPILFVNFVPFSLHFFLELFRIFQVLLHRSLADFLVVYEVIAVIFSVSLGLYLGFALNYLIRSLPLG